MGFDFYPKPKALIATTETCSAPDPPRELRVQRWKDKHGVVHWTFVDEGYVLREGFSRVTLCHVLVLRSETLRTCDIPAHHVSREPVTCFACLHADEDTALMQYCPACERMVRVSLGRCVACNEWTFKYKGIDD